MIIYDTSNVFLRPRYVSVCLTLFIIKDSVKIHCQQKKIYINTHGHMFTFDCFDWFAPFFAAKRNSANEVLRNKHMGTMGAKVECRFARKMSLSGKPP